MKRKRPMKLDDLFRMRAVGRVAMSPDGSRIAFELKRFDLKDNKNFVQLMIVDVADSKTRPLTLGKHTDTLPKWSPNGDRIAFLSDRDHGGSLWVMPMNGGEPDRVTDRDGTVHDYAFSPDGRRFAYTYQPLTDREKLARDEKTDEWKKQAQYRHVSRLHHKLDGVGFWNGQYTHVHTISTIGGRPRRLTRGPYDDCEPRFSPDGKLVSFLSNRVEDPDRYLENLDIYVVKLTGGRIKKLTATHGSRSAHSWSPDGQTIAYVGSAAKPGEWGLHLDRIWLLPAAGGRPSELTREIDNSCVNITLGDVAAALFEADTPIWSPDSTRLWFTVSENGATRVYSHGIKKRDLRCEVGGAVNVINMQRTGPDGPIALSIGTATNPGDIAVYDPNVAAGALAGRDHPQTLTAVNDRLLRRIHVGKPERFQIKSGPVKVEGWVIKPPGFNPKRKYPAILEIHGGPQGQYGYAFFHEMQWIAAQGYVVVFSNPRGSAGYGLDFMTSIHAAWGTVDYKDISRVSDWLFSRPYVDKTRVGITGGSYGGYMTNWVIGKTDRFAAAVTQRSVVSLESMYGTSDFGYHLGAEFGGSPWKSVDALRRQSPFTLVKKMTTPLLIIHSEQDLRCPIEQAEQLFTALKVLGREVEFVRFEGEPHGLSRGGRPQNRAERLRRIMGWFDKYLV